LLKANQISSEAFIDSEWKRFEEATLTEKGKIRTLPSKKSVKFLRINRYVSIAAVFLVLAISSWVLVKNVFPDNGGSLFASTSMVEAKLPDGTLVSLNSDSRIDFESFKGSERNVKLVGEAWFEVAHNAEKPFVVTTGDLQIKVLGTAFYVNARKLASKMELVLMRGRVAIYYKDNPDEFVILEPGEKVEVAGDHGKIIKKRNEDENFLAWKTKKLVFKDRTLTEAITLINKVYNSNLMLGNEKVGRCRISAEFDNQSLSAILNVLEVTLGVKVVQNGNQLIIKGTGCE
jgi:ferric-dicitrate binding protein FerR (iron transport regulator)